MKLLKDLNPRWLGVLRPDSGEGLGFDCPACGPSHTLAAYFTNPLDGGKAMPTPEGQRWERVGESFESLTVKPSLDYPCWHGWVEDGKVIHVSEATHAAMTPDGRTIALSPRQVAELRAAGDIS